MTTLQVSKARDRFSEIVNRVIFGRERIAVQRRDKRRAVLISEEDAELLEWLEDQIDLDAARKAIKGRNKAVDWEDFKKELGVK